MIWKVIKIIIDSYHQKGLKITNTRLQCILYFIQEKYVRENCCFIFDEKIVAWQVQVVFPEVHNIYSIFGIYNIPGYMYRESEIINLDFDLPEKLKLITLNEIKRTIKIESDYKLIEEVTQKGGAWHYATNGGRNIKYQTITLNDFISAILFT